MNEANGDPNVQRLLDILASTSAQSVLNAKRHRKEVEGSIPISRSQSALETLPPAKTDESDAPPGYNPAEIKTWSAAVQYVVHHLSRRRDFLDRLRKLKATQDEHEMRWWSGRQEILDAYTQRREGQQKINGILNHVAPGHKAAQNPLSVDEARDLKHYDAGVYKASQDMVEGMSRELRELQVPFFCAARQVANQETFDNRRKMISFLQDLITEE